VFDGLFYSVRDAIPGTNVETGLSRLYRANFATGDANDAAGVNPNLGLMGIITTPGNGLTTGMAFIGDTLYGVDDKGYLFTIDPGTAAVVSRGQLLYGGVPVNLQGLANGPQNVPGGPNNAPGYFADKLFAIDADGYVFCLDPANGSALSVFRGQDPTWKYLGPLDEAGKHVATGAFTGFAFSPIDIPLWRGTTARGQDPGHGVTPTFDNTRDGLFDNDGKLPPESEGYVSIFYGLDTSRTKLSDGTELALAGIVSKTWLTDISSGIGPSTATVPGPVAFSVTLDGNWAKDSPSVTGLPSTSSLRQGMDARSSSRSTAGRGSRCRVPRPAGILPGRRSRSPIRLASPRNLSASRQAATPTSPRSISTTGSTRPAGRKSNSPRTGATG
jgi:hypothetical protein